MVGVASLAAPTFAHGQAPSRQVPPADPFTRTAPHTLRVVTWNIGANSITPLGRGIDTVHTTRPAAFGRVMRAIDADIVCLQEFTGSTARLSALFDALHPLGNGRRWQTAQSLGNTIVSRFTLRYPGSRVLISPLSRRSHVYAVADVPDSIAAVDPVVVCTHLQSGGSEGNAAFRRRHSEAIARDLEARVATDSVSRPVIVLGDMNAVSRSLPYLLSMPASAGRAFPLRSAVALHNGVGPDSYTWRDDHQRFEPGVLDYVMFTERAFVARHAFVLNTMTLDTTVLAAFALQRADVVRDATRGTYDHLPVIADLEWIRPARAGTPHSGVMGRAR